MFSSPSHLKFVLFSTFLSLKTWSKTRGQPTESSQVQVFDILDVPESSVRSFLQSYFGLHPLMTAKPAFVIESFDITIVIKVKCLSWLRKGMLLLEFGSPFFDLLLPVCWELLPVNSLPPEMNLRKMDQFSWLAVFMGRFRLLQPQFEFDGIFAFCILPTAPVNKH